MTRRDAADRGGDAGQHGLEALPAGRRLPGGIAPEARRRIRIARRRLGMGEPLPGAEILLEQIGLRDHLRRLAAR